MRFLHPTLLLLASVAFLTPGILSADSVDAWHVVNRKPESHHLNDVRILGSGRILAVGEWGTIRLSDDGGASWSYPSSPTTHHLQAIAMIDELVGAAVGDGGVVIRTEDGGMTWNEIESPASVPLLDIAAGEDIMVAVGREGTIIRSDNRGRSWTRATWSGEDSVVVVAYAGDDLFLAGTSQGDLLVGSNGGSQWRALEQIIPSQIVGLSPVDDSTWYVAGTAGGDLYRTDDRGKSWRRADLIDTSLTYQYVQFLTTAHGYRRVVRREFDTMFAIITYRPYLEETHDSGTTWKSALAPDEAIRVDIGGRATYFRDSTSGISVGLAGSMDQYKQDTIDGRLNVHIIQGQISYHWTAVDCDDRGRCVVVGYHYVSSPPSYQSVVERSTDWGSTWNRSTGMFPSGLATTPYTPVLKAVSFIDENHLVAAGDSGLYARSVDGGLTWDVSRLTFGLADNLHTSIDFADPLFGAMTSGSVIAVTDDGGELWSHIRSPNSGMGLYKIIRSTPDRFVAFFYDSLSFSVDSGDTWTTFHYPALMGSDFVLYDIGFSSAGIGWAAGARRGEERIGVVMKSTDSGRTWVKILEQQLPQHHQGFSNVAFADDDHGIVMGVGTVAYITSNGGASWKMLSLNADELPPDTQGRFLPEQIAYRNPGFALAVNTYSGIILRYKAAASSVDWAEDASARNSVLQWGIAPNPASDLAILTIAAFPSDAAADLTLKIYDLSGRPVLDFTDEIRASAAANVRDLRIDIERLAAGRYIVVASNGERSSARMLTVVK